MKEIDYKKLWEWLKQGVLFLSQYEIRIESKVLLEAMTRKEKEELEDEQVPFNPAL